MYIKNRKKFRKVRFILLRLSKLFQLAARFRKPRRRILLVKIDAIGDYILFRNFLEVVKNSEKFRGYDIELLGNVSWKDLALEYDGNTVSQFYFIDEDSLYEKPKEVLELGWKLFKRRYETVLQSTYSRTLMGNGLAGLAAGKTSVAYLSEHEHHPKYKKQTDRLYTELLNLPDHSWHEYERNWYFFKKATDNAEIPWVPLKLPVEKKERKDIVIFPGSSWSQKNWEKEKFSEIIKRVLDSTSESIIISGGKGEVPITAFLLGQLPSRERIIDKTGNTTLPELVELISAARLVIANDTNVVHMAAATQTPCICIVGGGHFGRFLPYPEMVPAKPIAAYEEMPCFNCSWNCLFDPGDLSPYPCIARIPVEAVWKHADAILHPTDPHGD